MTERDPHDAPATTTTTTTAEEAPPLPIGTFPEADLVVHKEPAELPSDRWHRRKQKVIWPLISTATLSSLAIGILYTQRMVDAPLGIFFLLAMPLIISILIVLLRPKGTALKSKGMAGTAGVVALVQLAAVITSAVFAGDGAVCMLMAAPIMFLLTFGVSVGARAFNDARLERLDAKYKALMGIAIAIVLPLLAPWADRHLYAEDAGLLESVENSVVVEASTHEVWQSLQHLDVRFDRSDDNEGAVDAFVRELLPTPLAIRGDGASLGAQRTVEFDNGVVVATVTALDPERRYDIDLDVHASGREFFDHWVQLRSSSFTLVDATGDDGVERTRIVHTTTYDPMMFPRAVFRPIEHAFGAVIQQQLVDVYARRLWPAHSASPTPVLVARRSALH